MAGMTIADRVTSEEVTRRFEVKPVLTAVRKGRLKCSGYVKRMIDGEGAGARSFWGETQGTPKKAVATSMNSSVAKK